MNPVVKKIRLSIGTAIRLGLVDGPLDPSFTTAFIMTFHPTKCEANCAFCPQARESTSASDRLSRISWPLYDFESVLSKWPKDGAFARVCVQSLCYDGVVSEVIDITKAIRKRTDTPMSLAIHPIPKKDMLAVKKAGITTIGIALDACTPTLFDMVKGSERNSEYRWSKHMEGLDQALEVFGKGNVTTHLIIGLGETEEQAATFILNMYEKGVAVGLFAFTAIRGTSLEDAPPPDIASYRRIQVVRHLAHRRLLKHDMIAFDSSGRIRLKLPKEQIQDLLESGAAFRVSGCPGCNRPYYNERPSGIMYNYPAALAPEDVKAAIIESELME